MWLSRSNRMSILRLSPNDVPLSIQLALVSERKLPTCISSSCCNEKHSHISNSETSGSWANDIVCQDRRALDPSGARRVAVHNRPKLLILSFSHFPHSQTFQGAAGPAA